MLKGDPDFDENFKIVFNNYNIQEEDHFIMEVPEDIYLDRGVALLIDGEGSDFYKVTNFFGMQLVSQ